ncbi:MAG TPA: inorganic phosphate transporter, partial [Candidatus Polarisedimenticolia bacterium]|nr:inorganic phosphate transporter [Candidatus Polarisedimenticolia bacterium]
MSPLLVSVIAIILVALAFDFLNGFHDAANSVATIVSTNTLSPNMAVVWAAFFNFVAAFGFGVKVATTLGKGVVDPQAIDRWVILGGLLGAIVWDLLTWWLGLPVSSSHALIGGLAGAAVVRGGFSILVAGGLLKIAAFIVLSPLLGLVLGYLMMTVLNAVHVDSTPRAVDRRYRRLQLVSAAFYSLGHGTNDAQKTMGIISVLLYTSGFLPEFRVPVWVILTCHAAIAAGTLSGGWRIVRTMGMRITRLKPIGGFSAETAGALTLLGTALWGIPVSTTHTITGAIMGVGATRRLSAVRWGVARQIVWAWILTIPISALVSAAAYL